MEVLLSSLAVEATDTSRAYLELLTSLSPAKLSTQAALLDAEEQSLDASLKALAVREAASFSPAQSQVLSNLPDLKRSLVSLQAKLPDLEEAAMFDTERLAGIHQVRKEAALLERNESRLQELLDLPTTLKQCVSQGYYAEAADLHLHLGRIASRHPNSRLVRGLVTKAEAQMELMTLQLLALLNRPQKLPVALKVVGLLRRTGHFEEDALRYLFLKGRYDALDSAYAARSPQLIVLSKSKWKSSASKHSPYCPSMPRSLMKRRPTTLHTIMSRTLRNASSLTCCRS